MAPTWAVLISVQISKAASNWQYTLKTNQIPRNRSVPPERSVVSSKTIKDAAHAFYLPPSQRRGEMKNNV